MTDPVPFHAMSAEAALSRLVSAPGGLSRAEAQARLARHGPNRLPEARHYGPILRLLAQFNNILIYVLLGAATITATLRHWVDTGVILAVGLANAVIGFIQEGKAEAATAAIRQMLAPHAAVLRDGEHVTVDAADLLPADPGALEARGLSAQEAILTGESVPFDSRHRYLAVLGRNRVTQVRGAPERLLRMCRDLDCGHWHQKAEAMARQYLRVLAFAERAEGADRIDERTLEGGLTFLGLPGLIDPARAEAMAAAAERLSAGIRVKMITGDHAGTASAIARQMGLVKPDRVPTAADLDKLDDAQLELELLEVNVFARTSPEHKLRLVTALPARGLSVAMTGDGVNDAPALKRADAGIAMGQKGSEAVGESADLVLADDNSASIAAVLREGRTVYDNLKKVISWTLPTNTGESVVVVLALLLGLALPVTPVQILWINLITATTLGLALAFEPTEPGTMARPPCRRSLPILSVSLVRHVVLVAVLFAAAVFGIFTSAIETGHSLALAQTMAMDMLVVLEIFHPFFIRNIHGTSLTWAAVKGMPVVRTVVIAITVAQFAVTCLPAAQGRLGTEAVSLGDGLWIVAVGAAFFALPEIERQIRPGLVGANGTGQAHESA